MEGQWQRVFDMAVHISSPCMGCALCRTTMVGDHGGMHGLLNPNGHLGFASSSHLVECEPKVLWDLDAKQVSLFQARIDLSWFKTIVGCPGTAT